MGYSNGNKANNHDSNNSRNRRSNSCFYIKIISGVLLILVGIGVCYFNPLQFESDEFPDEETTTQSSDTKNTEIQQTPVWENNLLCGLGILVIILGLILSAVAIRTKRKSSSDIDLHDDPEELREISGRIRSDGIQKSLESRLLSSDEFDPQTLQDVNRSQCLDDYAKGVTELVQQKSVHDGENEFKRPKLENDPSVMKPNDKDTLVLFPKEYPNIVCTRETLQVVRDIIDDPQLRLKIQYISLEEGYIKIPHTTNTTRQYLLRTDPNSFLTRLRSQTGMDIVIKPYEYFSKRIILTCILEDSMEDAEFLPTVKNENQNMNTSRSIFEKSEFNEDTKELKIFFGVTPLCFKEIIDRDFLILIKSRLIRITLIDNTYPELFDIQ